MAKYRVKEGDTLSAIALKFYGNAKKDKFIAKVNKIENPNKIEVGQLLLIPQQCGIAPGTSNNITPPVEAKIKFYQYERLHLFQKEREPRLRRYGYGPPVPPKETTTIKLNKFKRNDYKDPRLGDKLLCYNPRTQDRYFDQYGAPDSAGWEPYEEPEVLFPGYGVYYNKPGECDFERDYSLLKNNSTGYVYGDRSKTTEVRDAFVYIFEKLPGEENLKLIRQIYIDDFETCWTISGKEKTESTPTIAGGKKTVSLPLYNEAFEPAEYYAMLSQFSLSEKRIEQIEQDKLAQKYRLSRFHVNCYYIEIAKDRFVESNPDGEFEEIPDNCTGPVTNGIHPIYLPDPWHELNRRLDVLNQTAEQEVEFFKQDQNRLQIINFTDNILRAHDKSFLKKMRERSDEMAAMSDKNFLMFTYPMGPTYSDFSTGTMASAPPGYSMADAAIRFLEKESRPENHLYLDWFRKEQAFFEAAKIAHTDKINRAALDVLDWLRRAEMHAVEDDLCLTPAHIAEAAEPLEAIQIDPDQIYNLQVMTKKLIQALRQSIFSYELFADILQEEKGEGDPFNLEFFQTIFAPSRKAGHLFLEIQDNKIGQILFALKRDNKVKRLSAEITSLSRDLELEKRNTTKQIREINKQMNERIEQVTAEFQDAVRKVKEDDAKRASKKIQANIDTITKELSESDQVIQEYINNRKKSLKNIYRTQAQIVSEALTQSVITFKQGRSDYITAYQKKHKTKRSQGLRLPEGKQWNLAGKSLPTKLEDAAKRALPALPDDVPKNRAVNLANEILGKQFKNYDAVKNNLINAVLKKQKDKKLKIDLNQTEIQLFEHFEKVLGENFQEYEKQINETFNELTPPTEEELKRQERKRKLQLELDTEKLKQQQQTKILDDLKKQVPLTMDQRYILQKMLNNDEIMQDHNKLKTTLSSNLNERERKIIMLKESLDKMPVEEVSKGSKIVGKTLGSLFKSLEVVNTVTTLSNAKDGSSKDVIAVLGAGVDLADAMGASNLLEKCFLELSEKVSSKFMKFGLKFVGHTFFSIFSDFSTGYVAWFDMEAALQKGEKGIAIANGMLVGAAFVGILGAILTGGAAAAALMGASAAVIGTIGVVLVVISIAAMIIIEVYKIIYSNTPTEDWLRFGPWGNADLEEVIHLYSWMCTKKGQLVTAAAWQRDDTLIVDSYHKIKYSFTIECDLDRNTTSYLGFGNTVTVDAFNINIKPTGIFNLGVDGYLWINIERKNQNVSLPSFDRIMPPKGLKKNYRGYYLTEKMVHIEREQGLIKNIRLTLYEVFESYKNLNPSRYFMDTDFLVPEKKPNYPVKDLFKLCTIGEDFLVILNHLKITIYYTIITRFLDEERKKPDYTSALQTVPFGFVWNSKEQGFAWEFLPESNLFGGDKNSLDPVK